MEFRLELVSYRHTVGETGLHVQLTPAYRRPIFEIEKVRELVRLYILAKAERMKIVVAGIGFGPDHIHIFLCNWKNYAIPIMVGQLKGFVSRMMNKNHKKLFKHLLWGDKFWTAGYFHRTVGAVTAEAMEYYVEKSQQRHWKVVDYEVYKNVKQKTLKSFAA